MKKFLLALIWTVISAASTLPQDETRTVVAWQVKKYEIEVSLSERVLNGKASLSLQNIGNTAASRVTLRINEKAEVSSVTINGVATTFTKGQERLGTQNIQRIIVNLPAVQPSSTIALTVEYKLKVEENTGLSSISPTWSQFLPLSFWYPTPNSFYAPRGADFAPFRLTVNTSSTLVSSGSQNANTFEQKLNGLPFFVVGDWDLVDVKGVTVYLPKGSTEFERQRAVELANLLIEAKTFVASLLGGITESPSRIVAVRRGAGFADGGTILLEYGAFRRSKIDAQTAVTIAESTAKLWLGNAVLVRGEAYGVIREGLARYIANLFIEKQFGKDAAENEWLRQRISYAAIARREPPLIQVAPLDDFYFSSTANKGALIWRLLSKRVGVNEFFRSIRNQMKSGTLTLPEIRSLFPDQKEFLDFWFDNLNDVNLLAGLPQAVGNESKIALRNNGSISVNTTVLALTDKGERLTTQVSLLPKSFGEAVFKTSSKIVRVEIDPEKLYPQLDFSDDVAPREFNDSDPILIIKKSFDKQDFATAERDARVLLSSYSHFDEARILLARSLLGQNKLSEAEREFKAVLDEKLVMAKNMAWAYVGLGEIASRSGKTTEALKYFEEAIRSDAEYGATLSARRGRHNILSNSQVDNSIKDFFLQFDKAAVSKSRTNIDQLIVPGEMLKFASTVSSEAQVWETKVLHADKLDDNNFLVEVNLRIRLINRNEASGMAVFYLSKVSGKWKLAGVEIFEVKESET